MTRISVWFVLLLFATPSLAPAQPVATRIPGVTAELVELRQHEGVLRLAVKVVNTASTAVPGGSSIRFADVSLVDVDGQMKYSGATGPNGRFLAGPMSDAGEGGRWSIALPANSQATLWMVFRPLPTGSSVTVQIPQMPPFENVPVTEGPSTVFSSTATRSTPSGLTATLVSAVRTKTGDIRVSLGIERAPGAATFEGTLRYRDVMLLRFAEKELYSLLEDTAGNLLAQPVSDRREGGRFWLNSVEAGQQVLMSLTFRGPREPVSRLDLLMPWFLPMTGIEITDEAGAAGRGR